MGFFSGAEAAVTTKLLLVPFQTEKWAIGHSPQQPQLSFDFVERLFVVHYFDLQHSLHKVPSVAVLQKSAKLYKYRMQLDQTHSNSRDKPIYKPETFLLNECKDVAAESKTRSSIILCDNTDDY